MNEMKTRDVSEIKQPEAQGFREIKPEKRISVNDARDFWDETFDSDKSEVANSFNEKRNDYFTSRRERMDFAEKRCEGTWTGEPGNSKFIPTDKTEDGIAAGEKLSEYGLDGVEYHDGFADFSELSVETVEIDMTDDRTSNYTKIYSALATKWNGENKDNRNNWTAREAKEWKQANGLSPHECPDMKTVMFIPTSVHDAAKHYGGVAECKAKNEINGGTFDE